MVVDPVVRERVLERLREICLALPETSERLSHGAPTFFVRGKRAFLMVLTNHHGDGRFAIWCAAPDGMQRLLVEAEPERFFVPPYVGHRGWLGVRLDCGLDWNELAGIAEDAYAEVAPVKLVGIFTERDVLWLAASGTDFDTVRVGDVMTKRPVTATTDVRIVDAARFMDERKIRHLPIVEGENLIGMVGIRDVLRTLVESIWSDHDAG